MQTFRDLSGRKFKHFCTKIDSKFILWTRKVERKFSREIATQKVCLHLGRNFGAKT